MKANKKSRLSDLSIDVAEYMFIEWLVRQGILSAYEVNCEKFRTCHRSFREDLRVRIRDVFRSPRYTLKDLVVISFPFFLTSEGHSFWSDQSTRWRRFCGDFKSAF